MSNIVKKTILHIFRIFSLKNVSASNSFVVNNQIFGQFCHFSSYATNNVTFEMLQYCVI